MGLFDRLFGGAGPSAGSGTRAASPREVGPGAGSAAAGVAANRGGWPGFEAQAGALAAHRRRASGDETVAASLAALDEYLSGGPSVCLGALHGTIPRKANTERYYQGWLCCDQETLCQHVLTFGGPGSGKSTRVIMPLAYQVLDRFQDSSIFAVVVKDEGVTELRTLCEHAGRKVVVVAPGEYGLNLIHNVEPGPAAQDMIAAGFSGQSDVNKHFSDLATKRVKFALTVIKHSKHAYTLYDAYRYCTYQDVENLCNAEAQEAYKAMVPSDDRNNLEEALQFSAIAFPKTDSNQREGTKTTLNRTLACFADATVRRVFCAASLPESERPTRATIDIDKVIQGGASLLVHVPPEIGEADIVYTLAKARFAMSVFRRPIEQRNRLIVALYDEYQNYASDDDAKLLDKSRQYGCGVVMSGNTYSALISQFANVKIAAKIIENCATWIAFDASKDFLGEIQARVGRAKLRTTSFGSNTGNSQTHQPMSFGNTSQSAGQNVSTNETFTELIGGEDFLNMSVGEALLISRTHGRRFADVASLPSVFVGRDGTITVNAPSLYPWIPSNIDSGTARKLET
jgi:hypothetical protein